MVWRQPARSFEANAAAAARISLSSMFSVSKSSSAVSIFANRPGHIPFQNTPFVKLKMHPACQYGRVTRDRPVANPRARSRFGAPEISHPFGAPAS
jgi:hypothetical protein